MRPQEIVLTWRGWPSSVSTVRQVAHSFVRSKAAPRSTSVGNGDTYRKVCLWTFTLENGTISFSDARKAILTLHPLLQECNFKPPPGQVLSFRYVPVLPGLTHQLIRKSPSRDSIKDLTYIRMHKDLDSIKSLVLGYYCEEAEAKSS